MSLLVVLVAATLASGLEMNLGTTEEIMPEKGEKMPPFAQTFPGCACTWEEDRGNWNCEGTVAYPEEVQGIACGCCGLKCKASKRKSDEECLVAGYDQKAELEAERQRIAELLKGADFLLGNDLPGYVVTLPKGACTLHTLVKACSDGNGKESDLTPLCDHTSYVGSKKCYSPSAPQFANRHFSHYSSHRQLMKLDVDDEMFYGMCFATTSASNALYPTGNSHGWASGGSVSPRPGTSKPKRPVPVAQMNAASGELGGWRTICVKNAPGLR